MYLKVFIGLVYTSKKFITTEEDQWIKTAGDETQYQHPEWSVVLLQTSFILVPWTKHHHHIYVMKDQSLV